MRDQVGNTYPEACRGELICTPTGFNGDEDCALAGKKIQVQTVESRFLTKGYLAEFTPGGIAMISSGLSGWKRSDAIRHEACHAVAGEWHPNSRVELK